MADVFVSYAREDIEFVRGLHAALGSERKIWVDWAGIPPSADWLREIHAAIEAAPSFIFVISPDSLASRVCGQELDHAALHKKRIIAVVHRDPETHNGEQQSVPAAVSKINWISAGRPMRSTTQSARSLSRSTLTWTTCALTPASPSGRWSGRQAALRMVFSCAASISRTPGVG